MPRGSQPDPASLLLRVFEVAAAVGFSERWVHQRIADGTIPTVRIGASVRVRRADVEAFARTGKWPAQDGKAKT